METYYYICKVKMKDDMNEKERFKVVYLQDAVDFLESISEEARKKLMYAISVSKYIIDVERFKKLKNREIWEFRARVGSVRYRILAFWDKDNETLVVATHGFIKKTPKTPESEISKAERMMKEYFKNK